MKSNLLMAAALATAAACVCRVDAAPFMSADQQQQQQKPIMNSANGERRLIELAPYQQQWMTELEVDELIRQGRHFMDVTDNLDLAPSLLQ